MDEALNDTWVTTRSMSTNQKLNEKEIRSQIRLGNKKHGKPFFLKQKEKKYRTSQQIGNKNRKASQIGEYYMCSRFVQKDFRYPVLYEQYKEGRSLLASSTKKLGQHL
ncbi:MAG: hypothetical protein EZS28_035982 [Streblomastix strix]|uniref:Uncharacterized protein n=1 Tax=Streblomastix strix TaxID=222440 RepID=A0A5J4UD16_9EUKA|nr:MAG: hypothetical protein EZS28_035982 [Streblomastix strix]